MPSSFLEKKLRQVPEEFVGEIIHFLDLLQYKINAKQPSEPKQKRKLGGYEGQIWMSADFSGTQSAKETR